jgi:hypothetical protein
MALQAFKNFQHFETHHCVSGALRHIYSFYGAPISEEMLLGLGEGVGFVYWHQTGILPFVGGRATPKPSMEEIAAQRTGVKVKVQTSGSTRNAERALIASLEQNTPVMLQVDMGFLPYFDFGGTDYHFGGHVVVACGYDPASGQVLIADREAELHPVALATLSQARGSTYKPFPPQNRAYHFDFAAYHPPQLPDLYLAMRNQAERMLHPPISNLGVAGIRKTAQRMPTWAKSLGAEEIKWTLFNVYIFLSPVGGSGGGAFRYMFSRLLAEVAALTGSLDLAECAQAFAHCADQWAAFAEDCKRASESDRPADWLPQAPPLLQHIADLEDRAWERLYQLAVAAPSTDSRPVLA